MINIKKKGCILDLKRKFSKHQIILVAVRQKDYMGLLAPIIKLRVNCIVLNKGITESIDFTKFIHGIVALSRGMKHTRIAFVVIKEDVDAEIIKDVSMFVNEVINLG